MTPMFADHWPLTLTLMYPFKGWESRNLFDEGPAADAIVYCISERQKVSPLFLTGPYRIRMENSTNRFGDIDSEIYPTFVFRIYTHLEEKDYDRGPQVYFGINPSIMISTRY